MQRFVFGLVLLTRMLPGADLGCRDSQLKLTSSGGDGAMGSVYTEITIQNVSTVTCHLQANCDLEQFDDRNARVPIKVSSQMTVNALGAGSPKIMLQPQEQTAITVQTLNRTGYDESRHCASQMHISRSAASRQKPLLRYATISCREDVYVTGFHPPTSLFLVRFVCAEATSANIDGPGCGQPVFLDCQDESGDSEAGR